MLCNCVIVETHKTKASTRFGYWISNDLVLFYFTMLFKVVLQINVGHLVVQATNKHLVSNGLIRFFVQLKHFLVISALIKIVLSRHILRLGWLSISLIMLIWVSISLIILIWLSVPLITLILAHLSFSFVCSVVSFLRFVKALSAVTND